MANKKKSGKPVHNGFLTMTAQAIGSTLGQLAKKAGVGGSPAIAGPARETAALKRPIAKKAGLKKKRPSARTSRQRLE
jgi:hypothetical protein